MLALISTIAAAIVSVLLAGLRIALRAVETVASACGFNHRHIDSDLILQRKQTWASAFNRFEVKIEADSADHDRSVDDSDDDSDDDSNVASDIESDDDDEARAKKAAAARTLREIDAEFDVALSEHIRTLKLRRAARERGEAHAVGGGGGATMPRRVAHLEFIHTFAVAARRQ